MLKLLPALMLATWVQPECKVGSDCPGGLEAPRGTQCSTGADCPSPQVCVHESQYYAQCVDCTPSVFATQCNYYSTQFLVKTMQMCNITTCQQRCPHHVDTDCNGTKRCAVQADGYWSQCVDCNATVFDHDCSYWNPKINAAAETLCKEKCPTPPA